MLSFATLKKDKKSYVNVPTVPRDHSSATSSSTKDPVDVTGNEPTFHEARERLYAALPNWIEIRTSAAEGRGLWTTQALKAGSTVLSAKPHIHTISNKYLDGCCSACLSHGTPESNLRGCTKCRVVRYCNSECQRTDWSLHKLECAALQKWFQASENTDQPPSDAVRCIARLLWKKRKKGRDSVWAKEIDYMQSHRLIVSKGSDLDTKSIENQTQLAHSLVQYLGVATPRELSEQFGIDSAGDMVDIISKFTTNTFSLADPSLTPIGACVSPSVALFNHSCDPNIVVVFPGAENENGNKKGQPIMNVVAIRDISPGEQLLTAYIDTTLPPYLRRKALEEAYFFTCHCHLCDGKPGRCKDNNDNKMDIDTVATDPRESLWCPNNCGGMCPLPSVESEDLSGVSTSCATCKTPLPYLALEEVLDAVRIGKEGLEKAERLQYTEPAQAKRLTTNLIPLLTSAGLSRSAHPLLALMRLNQVFLIDELPSLMTELTPADSPSKDQGQEVLVSPDAQAFSKGQQQNAQEHLDECIRNGSKIVAGLSAILSPGHPVMGIALAELGKLLAVDEVFVVDSTDTSAQFPPSGPARLKLAYDTLMRARASLRIGFGSRNEGGKVGREVREILVRLEKEIEVWKTRVRNVLGQKTS